MDSQELATNISVLESTGWFVAEAEDSEEFEYILECCHPDGSVLERVPISSYLLSLYDEEDGGLEERLWFFAPHYSTDMGRIWELIHEQFRLREKDVDGFVRLVGPYNINVLTNLPTELYYIAAIACHPYFHWSEYKGSGLTAALALCNAYLARITNESDYSGQQNYN